MARETEGFHYTFIHTVFGSFINDTLEFFADYLYPRFEHQVVGTYDKAVEYITKKDQYTREEDKPNLPAIILNPDGEFNLDEANTGARSIYRFPNLMSRFSSMIYDPIYQDNNNKVTVGFTRLKGTIELLLLLNSFYEYFDVKIFLIQMFGGEGKYIHPVEFDSFIIIPNDLYTFTYANDVTGLTYNLDWTGAGIESKLVRTTNRTEIVVPGKIRPTYAIRGMSDASTRHGGIDSLSDYRLTVQVEYEIELPSYMILETDYIVEHVNLDLRYGSSYSEYSDYNNELPQGRYLTRTSWDSGLSETEHSEFDSDDLPDEAEIVQKIELESRTRYFYELTNADIDSTSDIFIIIFEEILQEERYYLIVNSKYGAMTYDLHYDIHNSQTRIQIKRETTSALEAGDIIELYVYKLIQYLAELGATAIIGTDLTANVEITILLTSTSIIQSDIYSDLTIGVVEISSGTSSIVSDVSISVLTIGVIEVLSSTSLIETSCNGLLQFGLPESLSGTANITSYVDNTAIIYYKYLDSSPAIQSNTTSSLQLGHVESLSSSVNITTSVDHTGLIYIIVSLSASPIIQSNTTSSLLLGHEESLSGTSNITSNTTSSLLLGHEESLSGTSNITSYVDNTAIIYFKYLDASCVIETSCDGLLINYIERQTDKGFNNVTVESASYITQISNTDPAVATFVGGADIVVDGDMESDDAAWFSQGTPTVQERSSEQAHAGTYSRKFTVDAVSEGLRQNFTGISWNGVPQMATFWIYGDGVNELNIIVAGSSALGQVDSTVYPASWTKVFLYFDGDSDTTPYLLIRSSGSSGTWYIDDVSIQEVADVDEGDFIVLDEFGDHLTPTLWDADASVFTSGVYAWQGYNGNTVANVGNELEVTYVDDQRGAYSSFRDSYDLSRNLVVGEWYIFQIDAYYIGGASGVKVRLQNSGSFDSDPLTGSKTTYTWVFKALTIFGCATTQISMSAGNKVYIDNLSLEPIMALDNNVYEIYDIVDNTAKLRNHVGDLDLSDSTSATGAGTCKVITIDDWVVGDGVGSYIDIDRDSPELVIDGDMTSAINWQVGAGWSIGGGVATSDGSPGYLNQNSIITTGKVYKVEFEVTAYTSGTIIGYINSPWDWIETATGTYSYILEATSESLRFYSAAFIGSIDNVSIKEVSDISVQVTGSQSAETSIIQNVNEIVDEELRTSFSVIDRTAGGVTPTAGGTDGTEVITNGDHSENLITVGTDDSGLKISTGFMGRVDDLTIEEVERGSKLLGTSNITTIDSSAFMTNFIYLDASCVIETSCDGLFINYVERQINGDFSEISLGSNIDISQITNADPAVATFTLGTDLWDADAAVFTSGTYSWLPYTNTIANVGNELEITFVDHSRGAYCYLRDAHDLISDLTVGQWYKLSVDAYYTGGASGVQLRLAVETPILSDLLTGIKTTYTFYFVATSVNGHDLSFLNMGASNVVYIDNLKIEPFAGIVEEGDFINLGGFGDVLSPDLASGWDFTSGWSTSVECTIDDSDSFTTTGSSRSVYITTIMEVGKWYKVTIVGSTSSSDIRCIAGSSIPGSNEPGFGVHYLKCTGIARFYIQNTTAGITDITTLEIEEVKSIDDYIYEVGAFTDNTAPLRNHVGDLDLSDLAGVTGAGYGQVATIDDWTVDDGVGPHFSYTSIIYNEVVNGDMELDTSWVSVLTPTVQERSSEQAHSLTYSRKITVDAEYEGVQQTIPGSADYGLYKITAWIYGDATNKLAAYLDTESVLVYYSDVEGDVYPASWTKITWYSILDEGTNPIVAFVSGQGDTTGTWYIDDVSILKVYSSVQVTGSQSAETSLLQDVNEIIDADFRILWTVEDRTAGGTTPTAGGTDGTTEIIINGDHSSEILTAVGTDDSGLKISTGFMGRIDDITIEELKQYTEFSGTSNITTSDSTAVIFGFTAVPRQTNEGFGEITLGSDINISQITNTNPALVTFADIGADDVTNGDNEAALFTYNNSARGGTTQSSEQAHSGTYSAKYVATDAIGQHYVSWLANQYNEGDLIYLEAWVYLPSGQDITTLNLQVYADTIDTITTTDTWVKMSGYFDVLSSHYFDVNVEPWSGIDLENQYFYMDDIVTKKVSAPAPGDFVYLDGFGEHLAPTIWDEDAAVFTSGTYSWEVQGTNTIANVSNELEITHVDSNLGAQSRFRDAWDLSENTVIGQWYKFQVDAYYTGGSSGVYLRLYDGTAYHDSDSLTGSKITYTLYFKAYSETGCYVRLNNMTSDNLVYIDNLSLQKIMPLDKYIYEIYDFDVNGNAKLKNHVGDLDLSDSTAVIDTTGTMQIATIDDWVVGDGVGPYQEVDRTQILNNNDFSGTWGANDLPEGWGQLGTPDANNYFEKDDTNNRIRIVTNSNTIGIAQSGLLFVETLYYYECDVYSATGGIILRTGHSDLHITLDSAGIYSGFFIVPTGKSAIFYLRDGAISGDVVINYVKIYEVSRSVQVTGSQTAESSILQDASEDTTAEFRISWTLADRTAGGTTPTAGGTDGTEVITNDDHTETLITEDTSDSGLKISTGCIGTVDDLTIEELIYW
jgi:hypothetical protein